MHVGATPTRNMCPIHEKQDALQPLLQKHGVQAYFSGHNEHLAHLQQYGSNTHSIISGSGSGAAGEFAGEEGALFQQAVPGMRH